MRLLQIGDQEMSSIGTSEMQGLAGWVLGLLQSRKRERAMQQKQLRLIETLSLGGRKQVMLVECAGESFLVGGDLEGVQTIVRLHGVASLNVVTKGADEPCR